MIDQPNHPWPSRIRKAMESSRRTSTLGLARLRTSMTTHQHPEVTDTTQTVPQPGDPDVRWELVAQMKALIAAGKLDTAERFAIAEHLLLCDVEPES